MQILEMVTLVLVDLALVVYLFEKGSGFLRERRRMPRLVNHHPEMRGVHPDQDGLSVFESDDRLKDFVLKNNEPGADEPFYVQDEDLDDD